jgi:hypothetical protein
MPPVRASAGLALPLASCAAGILALAGCAGDRIVTRGPLPEDDASASAVVQDTGLELRWWVVGDRYGAIARTLAPYESNPIPADAEAVARWDRSGLRIVAVPLDKLTEVRDALPRVGMTNLQWLGESPVWVEGVGGPSLDRSWTVVLDRETTELAPGQLSLLVRDWLVPRMTDEGAMASLRVEILPQHKSLSPIARRLDEALQPGAPRFRTTSFEELRLTLDVTSSMALLIVPESPDVRWSDVPADAPSGDERNPVFGPSTPAYPTIGSAMLMSSPAQLGVSVNKAIVVLIPRIPERFELIRR